MKKYTKYLLIAVTLMFMGIYNVGAKTKVWSNKDGAPSSWINTANEAYTYPVGVIKISDAVNDSLDVFKDSNNEDDYILYYYKVNAANESVMYQTKLDKKVVVGNNTIYYGDPNDSEYASFLELMSDSMRSNGKPYSNFTPILVVPKSGTPKTYYINGGNPSKLSSTLKKWNSQTDYTNELVSSWNGLVHEYEDQSSVNPSGDKTGNKVDDIGSDVQKQTDREQRSGKALDKKELVVDDFSGCSDMSETAKLLRKVYNFIKYLIPVLIIGLSLVDFLKVVLNGDDKAFKETWMRFVKRLVVGVVILILPAILSLIINVSGVLNTYGIDDNNIFCIFV